MLWSLVGGVGEKVNFSVYLRNAFLVKFEFIEISEE